MPKLGAWRAQLDELLAANEAKPARERLTLVRLFETLRDLGFNGGYDAVRRYAKSWRKARGAAAAQAYVPLTFAPGEAYQFDWSHETILMNGVTMVVKAAHMRLCHSRMPFVRVYPRESQEMVFDAHSGAFAFFKGACSRGIYHNMKTAVETVFLAGAPVQLALSGDMQPLSGGADRLHAGVRLGEGQVENQVGLIRERFFTPRVRVKSFEQSNAWLLDRCVAYAKAHSISEFEDETIWRCLRRSGRADHRSRPLRRLSRGHGLGVEDVVVSFDRNKYSVSSLAVGRPVDVEAYGIYRSLLRQDGAIVGEDGRCFGRGQTIDDPWHYVPVLARKPGTLRNGAPFKNWLLPASSTMCGADCAALMTATGRWWRSPLQRSMMSPVVEAACAEALSQGVQLRRA